MNTMKAKKWNELITGILLTALGALSLLTPLHALSWFITFSGMALLVLGASNLAQYLVTDTDARSDWRLAKIILCMLTGVWMMLENSFSAFALSIPYLFSLLVCVHGVMWIAEAISPRKQTAGRGMTLFFGVSATLLGLCLFFAPLISAMLAMLTVSLLMLSYGVSKITRYVHMQQVIRTIKGLLGDRTVTQ